MIQHKLSMAALVKLPGFTEGRKMRVYFKDTVHAASIPQNRKYADGFLVMGKDATTGEPELQFDYAMEDGVQHIDMETFVGYKFLN